MGLTISAEHNCSSQFLSKRKIAGSKSLLFQYFSLISSLYLFEVLFEAPRHFLGSVKSYAQICLADSE